MNRPQPDAPGYMWEEYADYLSEYIIDSSGGKSPEEQAVIDTAVALYKSDTAASWDRMYEAVEDYLKSGEPTHDDQSPKRIERLRKETAFGVTEEEIVEKAVAYQDSITDDEYVSKSGPLLSLLNAVRGYRHDRGDFLSPEEKFRKALQKHNPNLFGQTNVNEVVQVAKEAGLL